MDILLATGNEHKKEELQRLLGVHTLHLPKDYSIVFDCEETGLTFEENAMQKALALKKAAEGTECENMPVLADDSGLFVDALPGELGIHTARYGSKPGEPILSADEKNTLLLKNLKGVPQEKRTARFVCTLVLLDGDKTIEATGIAEGRILEEKATGEGGFGYDPVFFCNDAGCSMATLPKGGKDLYSHRGKAAKEILKKIEEITMTDKHEEIPDRKDIPEEAKWDLSSLYESDEAYEKDLLKLREEIKKASSFRGKLSESPEKLLEALNWISDTYMLTERLGNYASLNISAEAQNPDNQKRMGVFSQVYTELGAETSFMDPEILSIEAIDEWMKDEKFKDYRVYLKKLLRQKEHTLSASEEAILAKQGELQETPSEAFSVLTNIDMDFGTIDGKPLSQSTYGSFMLDQDRSVREKAYKQFYETYRKHEQTISKLYSGSVRQDIFNARVRGFNDALESALYRDNVPRSVYTGLIDAVHEGFPILHRFYSIKKKAIGVDELRHYDMYVPMVKLPRIITPYEKACEIVREALSPLGKDYVDVIYRGITTDRWVDRYENKGKRSGAFSSGAFIGKPYILLNYKEDVVGDVFTLAHEGGHSMHSYYSKSNNPFISYDYTIFEAEVASTFNEQLVAKYYIDNAKDRETRAYIIAKQLDDIVATLFRQTMFAEFELLCHTQQENGEPLTVQSLRKTYRGLLEAYFGPEVHFEETSDLEGLRIPHFYRAYYVYKYATGISASIALSERVLNGGKQELDDYLGFLKSGGSRFPIDSLKCAGVDMSTQAPVKAAIRKFKNLLDQFEELTK
ncbi:MAG: oligoendopeptidase F [Sphaerochaetaceae bacterium]|nr:oligoendopeptidase F [Sphaerochaetaceae bacterium]